VARQLLIYELNEVPWLLVDRYLSVRPRAFLGQVLRRARTLTTVASDPLPLEPWRSWPSFHTGLTSEGHRSVDLGQDPSTFGGTPIWDAAADAGRTVGLFGALQSWPARPRRGLVFHVPDTFARTPECLPAALNAYQAVNLQLTRENLFSSDQRLSLRTLATAPFVLARAGVRAESLARLAGHVLRELRDPGYRAGRSIQQALPHFDVFLRLVEEHRPELSIFFTNHVAGMMHRYWADAMTHFGEAAPYAIQDLDAQWVFRALDVFDRQLRALDGWVRGGDRVVAVASSMGQAPIPYRHVERTWVLDDAHKLGAQLGLPPFTPRLAMYPGYSLEFADADAASSAALRLEALRLGAAALFRNVRVAGRTIHVDVACPALGADMDQPLTHAGRPASPDAYGLTLRRRLGGGNTAHHVPEGSFWLFGRGVAPDDRRARVPLTSMKQRLLALLGVDADDETHRPPTAARPPRAEHAYP
jgi:hypothetical protein